MKVVNPSTKPGSKLKRCMEKDTVEDRIECVVNVIATHADHVDATMESVVKEVETIHGTIELLPNRDDIDAITTRMAGFPTREEIARESDRVIGAFTKQKKQAIDGINKSTGALVKASLESTSKRIDEMNEAMNDSFRGMAERFNNVDARLAGIEQTAATKDDLKALATKDDLNVLTGKVDEISKKIDRLASKQ